MATSNPEELGRHVVELCSQLIRIDTTNRGDGFARERPAAILAADVLASAGIRSEIIEFASGRSNLVARVPGTDPNRGALLLHGHLDVVPAGPGWSFDPFSGDVVDGYIRGRGAVDMKHMVAMMLAVLVARAKEGRSPRRDIVLALFADEEAGSQFGSAYLCRERPDVFRGVTEAISEVGGFSIDLPDGGRAYLVETAGKGVAWVRLTTHGRQSHGSLLTSDNAIGPLADAVGRLTRHEWPPITHPSADAQRRGVQTRFDHDPADPVSPGHALEKVAALLASGVRHTANPTGLAAGDNIGTVPGQAHATVDGRFMPGRLDEFVEELIDVVGVGVEADMIDLTPGWASPTSGALLDAMRDALRTVDEDAEIIPFCNPASTDNTFLAQLGIAGYGFVPLRLPSDYDFAAMFHGRDERVPVDSVIFGAHVLDSLLDIA